MKNIIDIFRTASPFSREQINTTVLIQWIYNGLVVRIISSEPGFKFCGPLPIELS